MIVTQERRRFTRISFDANSELTYEGQSWSVHLMDLSFKGALVSCEHPLSCNSGDDVTLSIHLPDSQITLTFPCVLSHQEQQHIGLSFGAIDLDTLTHLRRLVELNIGDSDLLERELEHLFDQRNA